MNLLIADYSKKAQMKIQETAFMLVALVILFGLVLLIYATLSLSRLRSGAQQFADEEAQELARKMASVPELSFSSGGDCSACVDLDKALMLKEVGTYNNFWNLDYLMIERLSPRGELRECVRANYPDCNTITLIDKNKGVASQVSFVSLVRWDSDLNAFRYEFGRIHASGKNLGGANG